MGRNVYQVPAGTSYSVTVPVGVADGQVSLSWLSPNTVTATLTGAVAATATLSPTAPGQSWALSSQEAVTVALSGANVAGMLVVTTGPPVPSRIPTVPLAGIFNVRDFGAVGDGVTDDTAAILAAANAAQAAGGGVVYHPPGTYVAQGLPLYSNVRYVGAGKGATTLLLAAAATNHMFYVQVPAGGSLLNSGVSSLTIDGNNAGYYGVLIDASANINIIEQGSIFTNIRFQNCWVGFYHGSNNANAANMEKNTSVFGCDFAACNYGIALSGVYGEAIDNVAFFRCPYGAIITVGGAFANLGTDGKPVPGAGPSTQSKITNFHIEGFANYTSGTDYGMSVGMSGSLIAHGLIVATSLSMAVIGNPESGIPPVVDDITSWGCGGGLTLWSNDGMASNITLSNVGANSGNWPGGYTQRQAPVFLNQGTWSIKNVRGNYGAATPAYNVDVYQGTLYAENIELPTAGTAFLHNETPATNVITIRGSPGYNPVGSIAQAIPASGTVVAPAPYDQYLYITASTSTVAVNITNAAGTSQTVATIPASAYASVFIPGGSSWSLTYTTAPTALTAQGL